MAAVVEARADVCVVGGAGHVGAPLAAVLAQKGLRTAAYDLDRVALDSLSKGIMPFVEIGGNETLRAALAAGRLSFGHDPAVIAGVPIVVITIGTPVDRFHNPDLSIITRCIDDLLPYLGEGQTLILRSTVTPGVTEYVDQYLRAHGKNGIGVAFCPERVVQGQAIRELQTLPQIVSGTTPAAEETAARFFTRIAPKVVRMVVKEAEFAKLICNAYRYIQFAAANQFYMAVEAAGLDYTRLLVALKDDYPRLRDLPGPGFSAGPCLMKDTQQLAAFNNDRFPLGSTAVMINEGLPNFIVERLAAQRPLRDRPVGVLGMAFKADVDDIRESLSYKLVKILRFHGALVICSDEFVPDPTFVSPADLLVRSEVVIVGVPHTAYRGLRVPKGVEVVDLWNVLQRSA